MSVYCQITPCAKLRLSTQIPHHLGACMKDVYEILRQKEHEVSRLQKEVAALRVVAPLLTDEGEAHQPTNASSAEQQLIEDLRANVTSQAPTTLGEKAKHWLRPKRT